MRKLSEQMARDDANYEEAQSRLRMSMLCRDCVRPLMYPLFTRIVEFAVFRTSRAVTSPSLQKFKSSNLKSELENLKSELFKTATKETR